jgi:hypothetical protein
VLRFRAAIVIVALALAGGCGSDDEPEPTSDEPAAEAPTGATGRTDPEALNDAVIDQAQESSQAALQARGKEIEAILAKRIEGYRPGPNQYPAPGVDDSGDDCSVLYGTQAVPRNDKEERHVLRGPNKEET